MGKKSANTYSDSELDLRRFYVFSFSTLLVGLFPAYFLSLFLSNFLKTFGYFLVTSIAVAASSSLLGFLLAFRKLSETPNSESEKLTHLEVVSDWLTKLIIGAGLVELSKIKEILITLSGKIGLEINPTTPPKVFCLLLIVYFLAWGLLVGYSATRLWLHGAFGRADELQMVMEEVDLVKKQFETVNEELKVLDKKNDEKRISVLMKSQLSRNQLTEDEKQYIQELIDSDPNRGVFGGKSQAGTREFSGEYLGENKLSPGEHLFRLTVRSIDPTAPLTDNVSFYYHPTFLQNTEIVPVQDGIATTEISCWGSFTVGAIADREKTFMELHLSDIEGVPEGF